MTTLLLVRHGRTAANSRGVLAGRTPGIGLDETGITQARSLAERIGNRTIHAVITSPLERCQQTVASLGVTPVVDERFVECDYGKWTGQAISDLRQDPLWTRVQHQPSAMTFPGGESMEQMQMRALSALREWQQRIADEHGADATWVVCSHEDVIKSMVAGVVGLAFDLFQRIVIANAAITEIRFTADRPYLVRLNDAARAFPGAGASGSAD
ncbi:MAG: MSMEG_4193 family putative phosphomutase [Corynebacteriales bacterium]|nr:MSMEG_4193 family putative phosphomutase [Mycobacteriales bacterium]